MQTGEKLLLEHNPEEALQYAAKALSLKSGDPAAQDLMSRAQMARQRDRRRTELVSIMTEGQKAEQTRDWARATNLFDQVIQGAKQLGEPQDENLAQQATDELRRTEMVLLAINSKRKEDKNWKSVSN